MDIWFAAFDGRRERLAQLSREQCRLFAAGVLSHAYRELRPFFETTSAAEYLSALHLLFDDLWATERDLSTDRIDASEELTRKMDAGPNQVGDWVRPRGWSPFTSAVQAAVRILYSEEYGRAAFGVALGAYSAVRSERRVWDRARDPSGSRGYSDSHLESAMQAEVDFQLGLLARLERGEEVVRSECE